jgi:hypothetical protein
MTVQQLLADIHSLEAELIAFERKCGIRSEIFYPAYMGGGEPENDVTWLIMASILTTFGIEPKTR